MRRLSAILLLIPLGILFIGAVNLSSVCPVTPQDGCTTSADQCCHKGECTSKSETRKDHKKDHKQDQKSDRSACCFDCPLCALVTVQPFIRFEPNRQETTIDYAVSPDNSLTDYHRHHWKPPDTSRFS